MRVRAMLAATIVLGGGFAVPAVAHAQSYRSQPVVSDPYCAQQRQNRMLIGGAIGALAGAAIGRDVAARNTRTEGTVLGGAAGAAAGAAIGRATARCAASNVYQPAQTPGYGYGTVQPGYGYGEVRDEYGLAGGPPLNTSTPSNCRWGSSTTRDPDGREVRESVYMCRGSDGVWRRG